MIKPTPGRIVWFWPASRPYEARVDKTQPLAAIIAFVHNDELVNLTVFTQDGTTAPAPNIHLWQEGAFDKHGNRPIVGSYCEWMPYQKGQAAKTEALEAQLKT